MNECPVCGSPHDSVDGVIIHMRNMKDAEHAHIVSLEEAFKAIRESSGDSKVSREVSREVSSGDKENRGTQVNNSDMFDEPTTGAELSDYSGDDESDYLVLECGHQRVHKSDIPPDKLNVKCTVCGLKQGIKR